MSDPKLSQRALEAALVVEEISALYGYKFPEMAAWSAAGLRQEIEHLEGEGL